MVYSMGGYLYIFISHLSAWPIIGKGVLWRFKIPADVKGPGVQCIISFGYGKWGCDYRIKHLWVFNEEKI